MPLFLMVPVAAAISLGLAIFVVYAAAELPRFTDFASLGHGIEGFYGFFGSIFYAIMTMIVMGITLWRARSERAIKIAMIVLLAPIALALLIGIIDFGAYIARETQGILEFVVPLVAIVVPLVLIAVPLVLTVVVQWFLLRRHLRQAR